MAAAMEGGYGWVVVLGAFVVNALTLGASRVFSVYVIPIIDEFRASHASVASVAALMTLGIAAAGIVSIPMMRRLGNRAAIMIGGALAALGVGISSFVTLLPLFIVTLGLVTGIGLGICFISSPVVIGSYFAERRSLATNIASIGASVGTSVMSPLSALLIDSYSLRGYLLIYGAINLHLVVAGVLMRPPPPLVSKTLVGDAIGEEEEEEKQPEKSRTLREAFTDRLFWAFAVSTAIFFAGYNSLMIFLLPFAENELLIDPLRAPLVITAETVTEILSRVAYGFLGDVKRIDRVYTLSLSYLAQSICAAVVPFTRTFQALLAIRIVTGLFEGANGGLSIIIFADIVGDEHYGSAFGLGLCMKGLVGLILPIAAGIAVDRTGLESSAIWISVVTMTLGSLTTLVSARFIQLRRNRRKETKRQQPTTAMEN